MENKELLNLYNFVCELLCIDNKPKIIIGEDGKCVNIYDTTIKDFTYLKDVKGKYFFKENTVYLNKDLHNDDIELSLIHELRHAYQIQEINSKDPIEDKETIDNWIHNVENYLSVNETDHKTYSNQALELDANAFTYYIAVIVFGREIFVKDVEKDVLTKAVDRIASEFSIQELMEVAKWNNLILKITKR